MISSSNFKRGKFLSLFLLLFFLASCGETSNTLEQPPAENAEQEVIESVETESSTQSQQPGSSNPSPTEKQASNTSTSQKQARDSVAPGTYCFEYQDDTLTSEAELTVANNNQVTGNLSGVVQNDAEGYYTSYQQDIVGSLKGNQLKVDLTTKIELDTQTSQETWQLTANQLKTERGTYQLVDCSALNDVAATSSKRINFARGETSTVVSNSVIRGERDVYLLKANSGQTMQLKITSLEDNAVFDVFAPNGKSLEQEAKDSRIVLPVTGDYTVIVGGTRGNTTYDLRVGIN